MKERICLISTCSTQRTPNLQCTLFYVSMHLNLCNTSKFNYKKCWKECIKLSLDSSLLQLGGCSELHLATYALISPEVYIQTLVHRCFKNLIRINVCLMLEMFWFFFQLTKQMSPWLIITRTPQGFLLSCICSNGAIKQLNMQVCTILGHFLDWFLILFVAKHRGMIAVRRKKRHGRQDATEVIAVMSKVNSILCTNIH